MRRIFTPALCFVVLVSALLVATPAFAQNTLGAITGTVVDATGSAIPGATVTAISNETKLVRTAKSNAEGTYELPSLPIGTYTITFTMAGFSAEKIPNITVQADRTVTLPGKLATGAASDSVTVEENPLMNAVDTTNGYVLDKAQIEAIPLPTGSFTGMATQSPGVNAELSGGTGANSGLGNAPIWANGQRDTSNTFLLNGVDASNLFNGKSTSQSGGARVVNNTGVGNAGAGGVEQSSASIYLAVGNALPTPAPETIAEVRVNASMYDASQGSTSGAHIDLSTASGTNQYHGGLYFHHGSDALNAAPFFFKQDANVPENDKVPELHRYTLGGTAGGPIIPNKLFFFAAYQHLHVSDSEIGDSFLTVPAGLDNTAATRTPAGLAALANTDFGTSIGAGDVNPVASYLFNAKVNGQYMIPGATSIPTLAHPDNAFIPGRAYFTSDQAVADLDYNASAKDTVALKYYWQHDPTIAPYGFSNVPGFAVHVDAGSHVFSIQNTYLIKSNLSTTQTLGFDRMKAYATNEQPFTGPQAGITQLASGGFASSYFPGITIGSTLGTTTTANMAGIPNAYLNIGAGSASQGSNTGLIQNRLMPSANALWTLGKHSIGFGGNWSYTQLNIRDARTGKGMISAHDASTFIQGQIANQNDPFFTNTTYLVGNANRYYRSNQVGAYVQDKFQVKSNLSITAGIRYDWDGALSEKYGRIFNFDPSQYKFNTACLTSMETNPANCYPSNGIIIAGNNAQGTPGASKSTLTGRQWGFGPRLGVAWQPEIFKGKLVVRSGTGIYYDRGENFSFFSAGYAIGEVTGGPFGVAQSPPFVTAVQCSPTGSSVGTPGVNCDTNSGDYKLQSPFGSATTFSAPSGKASAITGYLQTPYDISQGAPMTTLTVYDQKNKLPYTINYTLDLQYQPFRNTLVELGYVGNLARHQVIPIPLNQAQVATPTNPINGQKYSYGYAVQTAGNYYCYYNCSPAHLPDGTTYQFNNEGGNVDLRVPYLGYAAESESYKAVGVAAYNALQAHVEQRLTHGILAAASYTYSHALDEQSDIGLFYTGNNALNLRSGYASADFDRTHVLNGNLSYKLPSFAPEHSLLGKFVDGWAINNIFTLESGQPYSVIDFTGAIGSLYYSTADGITNPVVPLAKGFTPKSALTGKSGAFGTAALNPNAFTLPLLTNGVKVTAADTAANGIPGVTADAPNGDIFETGFTQGQRNIFRQSPQKRLDTSIVKTFKVSRYDFRYTFDIFNVTNHASFDIPTAEVSQNGGYNPTPEANQAVFNDFYNPPSNVGFVQHTIGAPRQIQMSLAMKF
jgi:hypothetical protein